MSTPQAMLIRMIDAAGKEVTLFEITALCSLITGAHARKPEQPAEDPVPPPV